MAQQIVTLTDYPHFADVCAAWAFGQWGSQRGGTLERTRQRFALCSKPSEDFLTLLLIDGERPLGMASLWPSDDHHRMDLSPGWPVSLYTRIIVGRVLPSAWSRRSSARHNNAAIPFCI